MITNTDSLSFTSKIQTELFKLLSEHINMFYNNQVIKDVQRIKYIPNKQINGTLILIVTNIDKTLDVIKSINYTDIEILIILPEEFGLDYKNFFNMISTISKSDLIQIIINNRDYGKQIHQIVDIQSSNILFIQTDELVGINDLLPTINILNENMNIQVVLPQHTQHNIPIQFDIGQFVHSSYIDINRSEYVISALSQYPSSSPQFIVVNKQQIPQQLMSISPYTLLLEFTLASDKNITYYLNYTSNCNHIKSLFNQLLSIEDVLSYGLLFDYIVNNELLNNPQSILQSLLIYGVYPSKKVKYISYYTDNLFNIIKVQMFNKWIYNISGRTTNDYNNLVEILGSDFSIQVKLFYNSISELMERRR